MEEPLTITYNFEFDSNTQKQVTVALDPTTLTMIKQQRASYPEWTALDYYQCAHCPLAIEKHKYCPIARNLVDLVETFAETISFDQARITVATKERNYVKHTSLQEGVSSLLGIFMVTGGCPHMEMLKPMVRFHLPFASIDETMYRALSMYLLAQYFKWKNKMQPDWECASLSSMYKGIHQVNTHFAVRLRNIHIQDASLNAVAMLDIFAECISLSLEEQSLDELEQLFARYFSEENNRIKKNTLSN